MKTTILILTMACAAMAQGKALSTKWISPAKAGHHDKCVYCARLEKAKHLMKSAAARREWHGMVALHKACAHGKVVR